MEKSDSGKIDSQRVQNGWNVRIHKESREFSHPIKVTENHVTQRG